MASNGVKSWLPVVSATIVICGAIGGAGGKLLLAPLEQKVAIMQVHQEELRGDFDDLHDVYYAGVGIRSERRGATESHSPEQLTKPTERKLIPRLRPPCLQALLAVSAGDVLPDNSKFTGVVIDIFGLDTLVQYAKDMKADGAGEVIWWAMKLIEEAHRIGPDEWMKLHKIKPSLLTKEYNEPCKPPRAPREIEKPKESPG